jgi:thioredoxin reductase (NADPH)
MYDVIVIGGGPAGITAGIYCVRAGLKTLVLEKNNIGGQIASSPLVENYPGTPSISGLELANIFESQADELGVEIEYEEVTEIKPGHVKEIVTDCNTYKCKTVIVATGAKYRLLGLENEVNLIGNGISFCTACDGAFFKGKDVAVVGGGNTAAVNAIYLSKICNKVYLIVRKDKMRSDQALIQKINDTQNIEVLYQSVTTKLISNDGSLTGIDYLTGDKEGHLDIEGLFISIGLDAQTELVKDKLNLTEDNYIQSDDCMTNEDGIFVAGDCRSKVLRQLTTATSDGAIAATLAIKYLDNYEEC